MSRGLLRPSVLPPCGVSRGLLLPFAPRAGCRDVYFVRSPPGLGVERSTASVRPRAGCRDIYFVRSPPGGVSRGLVYCLRPPPDGISTGLLGPFDQVQLGEHEYGARLQRAGEAQHVVVFVALSRHVAARAGAAQVGVEMARLVVLVGAERRRHLFVPGVVLGGGQPVPAEVVLQADAGTRVGDRLHRVADWARPDVAQETRRDEEGGHRPGRAQLREVVDVGEHVGARRRAVPRVQRTQHRGVIGVRAGHDELVDVGAHEAPVAVHVAVETIVEHRRHVEQDRLLVVGPSAAERHRRLANDDDASPLVVVEHSARHVVDAGRVDGDLADAPQAVQLHPLHQSVRVVVPVQHRQAVAEREHATAATALRDLHRKQVVWRAPCVVGRTPRDERDVPRRGTRRRRARHQHGPERLPAGERRRREVSADLEYAGGR